MSTRHSPEMGASAAMEQAHKNGHETKNPKLEAFLTLTRDYFAENPSDLQNLKDLVEKTTLKNGSLAKNLKGFRESFENNLPPIIKSSKEYKRITKGLPDVEFAKTVGEIVKVWVAMQEDGESQESAEAENASLGEESPQAEPVSESTGEEVAADLEKKSDYSVVHKSKSEENKELEKDPGGYHIESSKENGIRIMHADIVFKNGDKKRCQVYLPEGSEKTDGDKLFKILEKLVKTGKFDTRWFKKNDDKNNEISIKNRNLFKSEWFNSLSSAEKAKLKASAERVVSPEQEEVLVVESMPTEEVIESVPVSLEKNEITEENSEEGSFDGLRLEDLPELSDSEVEELESNPIYIEMKKNAWEEFKNEFGSYENMTASRQKKVKRLFEARWELEMPLFNHVIKNQSE